MRLVGVGLGLALLGSAPLAARHGVTGAAPTVFTLRTIDGGSLPYKAPGSVSYPCDERLRASTVLLWPSGRWSSVDSVEQRCPDALTWGAVRVSRDTGEYTRADTSLVLLLKVSADWGTLEAEDPGAVPLEHCVVCPLPAVLRGDTLRVDGTHFRALAPFPHSTRFGAVYLYVRQHGR
jgi:hypothetical protein